MLTGAIRPTLTRMAKIAVSESALPIGAVLGLREIGHSVWLIPPAEAHDTRRLIDEFPPDLAVLRPEVITSDILTDLRQSRPRLRLLVIAEEGGRRRLPPEFLIAGSDDPIYWLRALTDLAPADPGAEDSPVGIRQTLLRLIDQTQQAFFALEAEQDDHQIAEIRRRLERSFEVSLRFLLDRLEQDVHGFAGHSSRVADHCRRVAVALGMSRDETQAVVMAGLLRDIGMHLVAPVEALRRAGPLQPVEWEGVHSHPAASAALVAPLTGDLPAGGAIQDHHERMDGSGYPSGKRGEDVPMGARIVAVADQYEAMTHARPHRPALPPERAIDSLLDDATAGRLDTAVVQAFIGTLDGKDHS